MLQDLDVACLKFPLKDLLLSAGDPHKNGFGAQ